MLFQSFEYIFFLLIIWICYWKIAPQYRWFLMLAAGCFYYALWNPRYTLLVLTVVGVTYITALWIEQSQGRIKKTLLIFDILFELGILFIFKYLGFFEKICNDIASLFGSSAQISVFQLVLPVGISFYIFQTIAYVIDVYRKKIPAERHLGYFAVSVIFFPILLAGPIERIPDLISQFKTKMQFSYDNSCAAFQRILLGYMKKMIIADSLAAIISRVYTDLSAYRGFPLLIAILLYSIEIYCDFSGYSDIAIGTAGLFGITIHANFRQPYFADSVKDFWRRWHISLTSWFRDYIYIPLGGNRVSMLKKWRNIMCVYLVSGLWHGADWTFLIWGGINGIVQIIESMCGKIRSRIPVPRVIRQAVTFVIVSVMWVFFRMESVADALFVIRHCFDGIGSIGHYLSSGFSLLGLPMAQCSLLFFFLLLLFYIDWREEKGKLRVFSGWKVSIVMAVAMFYYFKYGIESGTFIYFQF